ncbi:hypothetical protein HYS00_03580 [Candidatus Microgenomates bacterium]|nr:hypothetical protein [Candidatus Microgenomates bacterium]
MDVLDGSVQFEFVFFRLWGGVEIGNKLDGFELTEKIGDCFLHEPRTDVHEEDWRLFCRVGDIHRENIGPDERYLIASGLKQAPNPHNDYENRIDFDRNEAGDRGVCGAGGGKYDHPVARAQIIQNLIVLKRQKRDYFVNIFPI